MKIIAISVAAGLCATLAFAQDDAPGGRGRRGPAQYWWVNKTEGGVYKAPMRPLWKLSDLKTMHAGQNNWREQIILDPEQDATYNSAAPGTKFDSRMHPDTPSVFVVVAGEVHFTGRSSNFNFRLDLDVRWHVLNKRRLLLLRGLCFCRVRFFPQSMSRASTNT